MPGASKMKELDERRRRNRQKMSVTNPTETENNVTEVKVDGKGECAASPNITKRSVKSADVGLRTSEAIQTSEPKTCGVDVAKVAEVASRAVVGRDYDAQLSEGTPRVAEAGGECPRSIVPNLTKPESVNEREGGVDFTGGELAKPETEEAGEATMRVVTEQPGAKEWERVVAVTSVVMTEKLVAPGGVQPEETHGEGGGEVEKADEATVEQSKVAKRDPSDKHKVESGEGTGGCAENANEAAVVKSQEGGKCEQLKSKQRDRVNTKRERPSTSARGGGAVEYSLFVTSMAKQMGVKRGKIQKMIDDSKKKGFDDQKNA